MSSRPSALPALAVCAALVVVTPVVVHTVLRNEDDRTIRTLSRGLTSAIAGYHGQRVPRPVLRGAPVDANAAVAQLRAATPLATLHTSTFERLATTLRQGDPIPAAVRDVAVQQSRTLDAVRDTARRAWTFTDVALERGPSAAFPPYTGAVRASRLMLVRASLAPPGECLRLATDVVRLAHDLGPGVGLLGLAIQNAITHPVGPVALRCASRATPDERALAARELRVLIERTPSLGEALETEVLVASVTTRELLQGVPLFPRSGEQVYQIALRSRLVDVWQSLSQEPSRWRTYHASRYPDPALSTALASLEATAARHALSRDLVAGWRRVLDRDQTAQAELRAAALALAFLASAGTSPSLPSSAPPELSSPSLRDPFSGAPFHWRVEPGGTRGRVWSVGHNGRDEGGSALTDDVSQTFSLESVAAPEVRGEGGAGGSPASRAPSRGGPRP